jgi:tRNA A-37 threonylcarbamoyl transferase component Bud32
LYSCSGWTFDKLSEAFALRHQAGFALYNRKLYVFGGAGANDINVVQQYSSQVVAFDVDQNRWDVIGDMPMNQTAFPVVIIGDFAYTFGGATNAQANKLDITRKYDFINDVWTEVGTTNKPPYRSFASMVKHPLYDRLVVFGGSRGASGDFFEDVWEYTLETDTWSQQTVNAPGPGVRSGHFAGVYNNSMYIFGGRFKGTMYNDVWKWDFAGNWTKIPATGNLPDAKAAAVGAIASHGKMIIHGGGDQSTSPGIQYNSISILDLHTYVWTTFSPNISTFAPGARVYHAGWFTDGKLYVGIGGDKSGLINDIWSIADSAFLPAGPSSAPVTSVTSVTDTVTLSDTIHTDTGSNTDAIASQSQPGDKDDNTIPIAIGVSVGGAVFIVIVFLIGFFLMRTRKQPPVANYGTALVEEARAPSIYSSIQAKEEVESKNPSPMGSAEDTKLSLWRVDFNDIKLEKELGRGAFGMVYKGRWRNQQVAVKKFLDQLTEKQREDFVSECELIANIRPHEHVIQLLGICTEPYAIVVKYYEEGSLFDYLESGKPISPSEVIELLKGIAAGMAHLHSEKMVHRDLACRNILLSRSRNGLTAIISDFGFSRKLGENGNSGTTQSTVGPVRWMAPESLRDQIYSYKTDVFSFGVVVWEVMARALPWGDFDQVKVILTVLDGKTLEIPSNTPPTLAELMKSCWNFKPEDRPTAQAVFDKLNSMS